MISLCSLTYDYFGVGISSVSHGGVVYLSLMALSIFYYMVSAVFSDSPSKEIKFCILSNNSLYSVKYPSLNNFNIPMQ